MVNKAKIAHVVGCLIVLIISYNSMSCGTHTSYSVIERSPDIIPVKSDCQSPIGFANAYTSLFHTASVNYNLYNSLESQLGCPISREDNISLLHEVASWLGVTYKYAGSDRNGTDCSGLVYNIYNNIYGIKLDRTSQGQYEHNCKKISLNKIRQGDLVFFAINSTHMINHVGLYIKNGKFVHASTQKGVILSDLEEPYYKKYFYSVGRVK